MTLSARNHLPGTVEEITLGGVMAHVVVKVRSNVVESVITRRSAMEMKLKKGDKVTAIIKSTEVMLEKEWRGFEGEREDEAMAWVGSCSCDVCLRLASRGLLALRRWNSGWRFTDR